MTKSKIYGIFISNKKRGGYANMPRKVKPNMLYIVNVCADGYIGQHVKVRAETAQEAVDLVRLRLDNQQILGDVVSVSRIETDWR